MHRGRLYTAANDGTIRIWDATKIRDDDDLEDDDIESPSNSN